MSPNPKAEAQIAILKTPPPAGSPYAVPLPNTEREGRSPIYRHWRYQDKPLLETFDPAIRTFYDYFQDAVARFPKNKCLGARTWDTATQSWSPKFSWQTFAEVDTRSKNFGSGIVELHQRLGVPRGNHGVGIWCQNRPEWQITDLGLTSQSLFSVSLYEQLGPDASEYILNHAELTACVTSLPHIPTLIALAPRVPTLKVIISLDPLDAGEPKGLSKLDVLNEIAKKSGIQIWTMADVEKLGAQVAHPVHPPSPEDILTINYTSGTTGDPKGVVLTHRNCVAALTNAQTSGQTTHKDVALSYLPLAHIYGRMADQTCMVVGGSLGFFHGDMLELLDDLKILRPTGLLSVPRLFNRFKAGLEMQTVGAPGFRGTLSKRVIETKTANMKLPHGQAYNTHLLYDRFWTPKVRAGMGLDRCHSMMSGSAQLDPSVQTFLRAALGNSFMQGYGLTESYAVSTFQSRDDFSTGNIGGPVAGVEICLESVPDYEYFVTDKPRPRGELLLRGPTMFREYYKNEVETKKALDADGWFHTGDIVEIDELGRVKIIDRKKNVLKLSQGEYISPERIENVYLGNSPLISTAYVHGSPSQSALVAVFGVDPVNFAPWASKIIKQTIEPTDVASIKAAGKDPKVAKAFIKHLDDIGRKAKFNGYERVRGAYLDVEPFSIENGLFTPTLKLKRPQAAKAFANEIDAMYEEINTNAPIKAML